MRTGDLLNPRRWVGQAGVLLGVAVLLLSLPVSAQSGQAAGTGNYGTLLPEDELQDDFSDGWKDCLWKPYVRTAGQVTYHEDWEPGDRSNPIYVSGGKLEMELPANKNPGQSWELGLESKFMLSGDFTVEVDYELSSSNYRANLDMRGINLLFIELMGGDQGSRRRHVRRLDFGSNTDERATTAHLWLSNPAKGTVTQIDTDAKKFLRAIKVGQRPGRTAVDLLGNVYVHNRGDHYSKSEGDNGHTSRTKTTVTFIKASACPDPECDLNSAEGQKHVYTLDFSTNEFGPEIYNGMYGGGVAVDRNNDVWIAFREPGVVYHLKYHPSDTPGGDTWTHEHTYDVRNQLGRHIRIYGIAMARDGNLWLATRGSSPESFVRLNTQTGTATAFSPPGGDGCINTYGFAIDSKQRLFWATYSTCRGFRFDPAQGHSASAWTRLTSTPSKAQEQARGMAADSQGRIWLAADVQNKLVVFDQETAKSVKVIDTCKKPAGVALDRNNLLWASCQSDTKARQVRYYNMDGDELGSVPSEPTYTYSDMTGYQLRNFGLEDWEESFLVGQGEITGTYYTSTVVNNYGGGIEVGAGGDAILDPAEAPFDYISGGGQGQSRAQAQRMRTGSQYYTDQVPLIAEQPARLEGVWGFRMPGGTELSASPLRFTLKEDSYVYVAFEEAANPVADWARGAQGWSSTNEVILTTDSQRSYVLYRKLFDAGDEVVLGGANEYGATPPAGAPFLNYFVYVYPTVLDGVEPQSPEAYVDQPSGNEVRDFGRLRISRVGAEWKFSYRDGGSAGWGVMTRDAGPVTDVPIRLRTRLDPFWHAGPHNNLGGALHVRFDNFAVTEVDGVPGGPYCREGCDETVPGYGGSCLGGDFGLCPGVFECEEDVLTCKVQERTERCNGLDDDCDEFVDHNASGLDFPRRTISSGEHFQIVEDYGMPGQNPDGSGEVYEGHDCTTSLSGPCAAGYWECVGGAMVCQPFQQPQPDWCNNIDNSCIGDDPEDQELLDPLVRLNRFVQISQRSAPNTPIRPVVGALEGGQGVPFTTWAGFDGSNVDPQRSGVVEAGKARVILYLDRTLTGPGSHPELGSYVLWLAHGERSPDQGAASASYMLAYTRNSGAKNLIMQDGVVREGVISSTGQAQFVTVQSGEGQSGGVAIGPFPATEDWAIDLSAHFTGDVRGWELYSATTGEVMELSPNETLSFSNNSLGDDFYGALTMEVGSECHTGEHGICARGASRCVQDGDGNWEMVCLPSVVAQLEVCDGRDNSCSGEIDNNSEYGFAVPMVQYQKLPNANATPDEDAWQPLTTVDQAQSALEYLNFRRRGVAQGGAVGSPEIMDVVDKDQSIQKVDRSVFAVHRDMRQANGTLSLVMAHGKYVEEPESTVPNSRPTVSGAFYQPEAAENFLGWFDDMADQEDGASLTERDRARRVNEYGGGDEPTAFEYKMDWELHRWVTGGAARREADGGVIMDLFPEKTDLAADFRPMLTMSGSGLSEWRLHSPYINSASMENLSFGQTVAFRVYTATSDSYWGSPTAPTCIIQENDVPECLGQEDHYMCNDGVLTCGLGTAGCCSPEHPLYDTPCGLDDDQFINVGACRSALRCRDDGSWQCEQVVSPQPETCDGFDNTCDGMVDGFKSGFIDAAGDVHNCPGGAERCGPAECDYLQICQCAPGDDGPECACVAALEEILHSPYERICEDYERLEEDRCVPVGTVNE